MVEAAAYEEVKRPLPDLSISVPNPQTWLKARLKFCRSVFFSFLVPGSSYQRLRRSIVAQLFAVMDRLTEIGFWENNRKEIG